MNRSPLCLALSLLLFVGCARRENVADRGTREGILHLAVGNEPTDLDPHTVTGTGDAKIVHSLFEPLVSYDPTTLAPVPALAERWEISPDGLTYTFYLRAAKWSNGEPITAQDCVDSWQRMLTPSLGAEYAYFLYLLRGAEAYYTGKSKDFSTVGASARDARTLVATLEYPAPYFLQMLLNSPWRPVNVRAIAAVGDPSRRGTPWTRPGKHVSSGPFVLKEWTINQHIIVARSPTYWARDQVQLNAVHFYPIDNIDAQERAYRAGQLHATWDLPLSKILPLQREKSPALRIDPLLETHFFRLNVRREPFDDVRVRRAFALAIDRVAIANKVLPGGRRAAETFVPSFLAGYTPPAPGQRFDPPAARKLLAEAGHAGGAGLPPIEVLYHNSEILRLVAEAIQQMWQQELGVTITLLNQEKKTVAAARRTGDYHANLGTWTADYLDATTFLDMWYADSGNNQTGWASSAFDALLKKANTQADPAARATTLAKAEGLLLEEAPIIPVYFNSHIYLLHPAVRGWQPTPMDHTEYRYVRLSP